MTTIGTFTPAKDGFLQGKIKTLTLNLAKGLRGEGRYREAEKLVLVMDQLNTHSPASLYEAFPPEEAKRLADRLEIHHTPKHGSWLNMAEIELSVLARQCLSRRIAHQDTLKRQIEGWEENRNAASPQIKWQFTTQDARIKLRSLYPSAHA